MGNFMEGLGIELKILTLTSWVAGRRSFCLILRVLENSIVKADDGPPILLGPSLDSYVDMPPVLAS